jgi:hypothetical protein
MITEGVNVRGYRAGRHAYYRYNLILLITTGLMLHVGREIWHPLKSV